MLPLLWKYLCPWGEVCCVAVTQPSRSPSCRTTARRCGRGSARPPSLWDARRGQILLLLAEGLTVVQVATRVGITRRFVYKWARRFLQHGIEGLADTRGRGR